MRKASASFEELVRDANQAAFAGWDFSYLDGRLIEEPLPWDYLHLVRDALRTATAMLDLDTGGGERLAGLAPLPRLCVATETYPPNIPVASKRLRELGAHVVQTDSSTQNQFGPSGNPGEHHPERRIPFADQSFDLITCRHGSFSSEEVARVLKPGGTLIAQLVGEDNHRELNRRLNGPSTIWRDPSGPTPPSLEQCGLDVLDRREARPAALFKDIGAVVYYLRAVPWQIADFSIDIYRERLSRLHEEISRDGGLRTRFHRHLVVARKRLS